MLGLSGASASGQRATRRVATTSRPAFAHDDTRYFYKEDSMDLQGKKVIALGERDGVQGHAIAQCATSAGAQVVLEMTHCFV
jgi:betaine reductase